MCYAHLSSCHAGVCDVAEGFCVTAAGLPETSRFPTRRMRMDEVKFHCEPPTNVPTMVVAFGGWVDAGETATGAMRSLVRQLAATPLATIDPEAFVDFTTLRPVVRLSATGERTIRWPRIAFWAIFEKEYPYSGCWCRIDQNVILRQVRIALQSRFNRLHRCLPERDALLVHFVAQGDDRMYPLPGHLLGPP